MVLQYGVWDQVRVDHGKEWTLMLFVQEQLAHLRHNVNRAPHLQTTSKQVVTCTFVYLKVKHKPPYIKGTTNFLIKLRNIF